MGNKNKGLRCPVLRPATTTDATLDLDASASDAHGAEEEEGDDLVALPSQVDLRRRKFIQRS